MILLFLLLSQTPSPEILAETVQVERISLEFAETFWSVEGPAEHADLAVVTFATKQPFLFLPRGGAPRTVMFGDFECGVIIDFVLRGDRALCVAPWPEDGEAALWIASPRWSPRAPGDVSVDEEKKRAQSSADGEWLVVSVPPDQETAQTFFDSLEALESLSQPR
jgi:hypothetical protein